MLKFCIILDYFLVFLIIWICLGLQRRNENKLKCNAYEK